jgi:5'-3' exonuclease
MQVHLVDATYELFRAFYAPRPPVFGKDRIQLSGVSGLVDQLLFLLREQGATHVGAATDRVIESFRNDLYPGYKSSAGMDPQLLRQFPIAEQAIEALGVVLWPMVEWEADDAIGAAAKRFAADPRVERIVICTPDKDMAQLVVGDRIVGRRARKRPRPAGARWRQLRRLPRAARVGGQGRRGGAREVPPP